MKVATAIKADADKTMPNLFRRDAVVLDDELRLLPRKVVRWRMPSLSLSMLKADGDFTPMTHLLAALVDNGAGANPVAACSTHPAIDTSLKDFMVGCVVCALM